MTQEKICPNCGELISDTQACSNCYNKFQQFSQFDKTLQDDAFQSRNIEQLNWRFSSILFLYCVGYLYLITQTYDFNSGMIISSKKLSWHLGVLSFFIFTSISVLTIYKIHQVNQYAEPKNVRYISSEIISKVMMFSAFVSALLFARHLEIISFSKIPVLTTPIILYFLAVEFGSRKYQFLNSQWSLHSFYFYEKTGFYYIGFGKSLLGLILITPLMLLGDKIGLSDLPLIYQLFFSSIVLYWIFHKLIHCRSFPTDILKNKALFLAHRISASKIKPSLNCGQEITLVVDRKQNSLINMKAVNLFYEDQKTGSNFLLTTFYDKRLYDLALKRKVRVNFVRYIRNNTLVLCFE